VHDNAVDFVFPKRRVGFHLGYSQVRKIIKKSLADIGVHGDHYSSHSLQRGETQLLDLKQALMYEV
jgi:hypothetical protein